MPRFQPQAQPQPAGHALTNGATETKPVVAADEVKQPPFNNPAGLFGGVEETKGYVHDTAGADETKADRPHAVLHLTR